MSEVDVAPASASRPPTPSSNATKPSLRPAAAVLLVVLGLGLVVLWRIASGTEQHSWDRGAVAPAVVELTGGHTYAISIAGGVPTEVEDGVSPDELSCSASASGIGTQRLTLADEQEGTKATNQIASFVSPVTGSVEVACRGLTGVFVDDADGAGFDWAGVLLWFGVAALAVGLPLGLSTLRESVRAGDDDEIE
ncbi:hypothetical protein [Jatrophihabitans endophyticus]|uniref:hypothetical protein n=1 Tax=Jatrophihabitans endophyticus TaxID=1206085 RepID=UPI0019DE601D|nr:hypothetical protein [Jatrophihabitans endophyticus]MBE7187181.1 hypothetical protein [Jatrophihabitans endophyticus]